MTIVTERISLSDRGRSGRVNSGAEGFSYAPRYSRRLEDKILIAFHQACDQGESEVAAKLVRVLEMMLYRSPPAVDKTRRRNETSLVAALERLWFLRRNSGSDRLSDIAASAPTRSDSNAVLSMHIA